jgi:hypothetical protein
MDRKAIRSDDQRVERNRLIEFNRQKRAEKVNDDEKSLEIINKQIMVFLVLFHLYIFLFFFFLFRLDLVDYQHILKKILLFCQLMIMIFLLIYFIRMNKHVCHLLLKNI